MWKKLYKKIVVQLDARKIYKHIVVLREALLVQYSTNNCSYLIVSSTVLIDVRKIIYIIYTIFRIMRSEKIGKNTKLY